MFGSLNWSDKKTDHGGLGEIGGRPRPWRNGFDAYLAPAERVCGGMDAMVDGVLRAAPVNLINCCESWRGMLPVGLRIEGIVNPRGGGEGKCVRIFGTFYKEDCTFPFADHYRTIFPQPGDAILIGDASPVFPGCGETLQAVDFLYVPSFTSDVFPELRHLAGLGWSFEVVADRPCGQNAGELPLGFRLDHTITLPPGLAGELSLGLRLDSTSHFTPAPTGVVTDCCGPTVLVPQALKATLQVPGCACLNGAVINIDYQATGPDAGKWVGTGDPCAGGTTAIGFKLRCEPGALPSWHCEPTGCIATIFDPSPNPMSSCSPFRQIFDSFSVPPSCCPGGGGALLLSVTFEPR